MTRPELMAFIVFECVPLLASCDEPESIKIETAKQKITESINAKKPICSPDSLSALRTTSGPDAASSYAKLDDCQKGIDPLSIVLKNMMVSKVDSGVTCGDIVARSPLGNNIDNKVVLLHDSVIYGDIDDLVGDNPRIVLNRITEQQYKKYCK